MGLFDKIKDTVTNTVDTVANTVESAATNAWETGESLVKGDLKDAGKNLVDFYTEPVDEVLKGASKLTENVSDIADEVGINSNITNTAKAAIDTQINIVDAVVTNVDEGGKSLIDGDVEGTVNNVVDLYIEPLEEGVVGASQTASAAGTDLGTVGTAIGGVVSTTMYGNPTTGAAIGGVLGNLADKYAKDGEITVDDVANKAGGAAVDYISGVDYVGGSENDVFFDSPYISNTPSIQVVSNENPSVYLPTNNQSPQPDTNYPNANENPQVGGLPVQDEPIIAQGTKTNTEYGNYESLKNELGLGQMPTVSQDSYAIPEDTNGDGTIDYVYDRDNPSIPYHIAEDTNGDGKIDSIYNRYDTDGDGYYETVVDAVDYNKDGNFDFAYKSYDTNGDGHHDSVVEVYDRNSDGYTDETIVRNDNNHDGYFESEVAFSDDGYYDA